MDIQMNTERFHTNCNCNTCIEHQSVDIEGHENYRIFKDGRVWSKIGKGKFLKHIHKKTGYIDVRLSTDGKIYNLKLHRLIAIHYIPNPDNKPTIDHINRIKDDNRIKNLRWATSKEQSNNRKIPRMKQSIKSGHKFISPNRNNWEVNIKRVGRKCFKNKIDAICYKYILLLKIKSKYY